MKVATVLGARPQFIKAAPVSKALREAGHQEVLIHTGQHYDYEMSDVFFRDLDLPRPDINLNVGSASHGRQTGEMLIGIEEVLGQCAPDKVLVFGDTNSTLAGALAACKLRIPLAHVEAGLRSFNREMPEEHNRVLTDHCSDILFCPTQAAVSNLIRENVTRGVHFVGDTMLDAVLQFRERAGAMATVLPRLKVQEKGYLLATIHRPYNIDNPERLAGILQAFGDVGEPIVLPVHPRARKQISALEDEARFKMPGNIHMIGPVGYLDMLVLEDKARMILTDSGGVQKEAYLLGVPCVTLRPETEWVETVHSGWNVLAGSDRNSISRAIGEFRMPERRGLDFGDGRSAQKIVDILAAT